MKTLRALILTAGALLAAVCHAAEINVFAAASLSDVFTELAPQFTAATGHTLRFNFGAYEVLRVGGGDVRALVAMHDRIDLRGAGGLLLRCHQVWAFRAR